MERTKAGQIAGNVISPIAAPNGCDPRQAGRWLGETQHHPPLPRSNRFYAQPSSYMGTPGCSMREKPLFGHELNTGAPSISSGNRSRGEEFTQKGAVQCQSAG